MYYGTAYYPEHWPEERWAVDAALMRDAGVNAVRMGEFAWSAFEPEEGVYDFSWMDRAVALLGAHGVRTMMCTCSRTPPPWVFQRYPQIRNTRANGQVSNYGHRYTVCHNDPLFVELSRRIDQAVVAHYAGHPEVIAWQIDNEIGSGNACYCDTCRRAFVAYLAGKYGTIEALNERWGAHFWSSTYSSFEQVPLPAGVPFPAPSLALEYARFQSRVNADFCRWRYDLIKRLDPDTWVTTNFQTSARTHTDIFELGSATDVYGTNLYPPWAPEFALDYCRGARGKLLILEQRSGQPHWLPAQAPGWMRLWAYRSLAHGACGINFFRWRPCRWGQEQYWHGILPHSGRPGRRYRELAQMGHELQVLGALIDRTHPVAETAIVMSYESRWALDAVLDGPLGGTLFGRDGLGVHDAAVAYHTALMDFGVCTDAMDPREDLSQYRLVIAPRLYCAPVLVAEHLERYVAQGGVLVLTPRSGVVDEWNTITPEPAPGPLRALAGVEVDDYGALDEPVALRAARDALCDVAHGTGWADEIRLCGAERLLTYDDGWLAGQPAVTIHAYGAGHVVYVGTLLRGRALQAFVSWLCTFAGVRRGLPTPEHVRAHERQGDEERLLFLINYGTAPAEVALEGVWDDPLTGETQDHVRVEPVDVRVLRRAR